MAALQQTIALTKQKFSFELEEVRKQRLAAVIQTEMANFQVRETTMSGNYLMRRIWTVSFSQTSTTTPLVYASTDHLHPDYTNTSSQLVRA